MVSHNETRGKKTKWKKNIKKRKALQQQIIRWQERWTILWMKKKNMNECMSTDQKEICSVGHAFTSIESMWLWMRINYEALLIKPMLFLAFIFILLTHSFGHFTEIILIIIIIIICGCLQFATLVNVTMIMLIK